MNVCICIIVNDFLNNRKLDVEYFALILVNITKYYLLLMLFALAKPFSILYNWRVNKRQKGINE